MSRSWHISRRTFLRGSGAALGLPILDAMGPIVGRASAQAPASATTAKEIQPPVRMACMYFPNGVWEKTWFPKEPGPRLRDAVRARTARAAPRRNCSSFPASTRSTATAATGTTRRRPTS